MNDTSNLNESLSLLAIAAGLVMIAFIIARYTYLVKKAMIENGIKAIPTGNVKYMDIGCIVIGLGMGLLVSSIFTEMDKSEDTIDLMVWGTVSIFAGIGLLVAHLLRKRIEK